MGLADQLTRALERQGIPITGVSIGREGDRATWRIDYTPAATAQHRTDGDALRLTFDPLTDAAWVDEQADRAVNESKAFRALARATFELKTNAWTLLQFSDRIKAIYKTL
jgi:hypothetical protein